ncbi:hypothetical protein CEP53_001550 [Fusarium sp. AF-6]|nr:hypothetical protein CEP53_001550 [Fusarium sp. AF-6]
MLKNDGKQSHFRLALGIDATIFAKWIMYSSANVFFIIVEVGITDRQDRIDLQLEPDIGKPLGVLSYGWDPICDIEGVG